MVASCRAWIIRGHLFPFPTGSCSILASPMVTHTPFAQVYCLGNIQTPYPAPSRKAWKSWQPCNKNPRPSFISWGPRCGYGMGDQLHIGFVYVSLYVCGCLETDFSVGNAKWWIVQKKTAGDMSRFVLPYGNQAIFATANLPNLPYPMVINHLPSTHQHLNF